MKRQSLMTNGRPIVGNGGDLLSGYHTIQPSTYNHTFTYGSSYARARDAAVLATSLHWNRDIKSMVNRSPSSGINKTLSPDNPMIRTIGQHYYPEGGWGWIISVCSSLCYFITASLFPAHSFLILDIMRTFKPDEGILAAVLIGAFSTMVTLIFSPVIIALCRRKSIRLTAVVGGLVTALGCLFTSFATQFHQLLISYGIFIGIGVSMLRDTSVIMIGQYFKKRREFVEIFVSTGNGLGIALMPIFLSFCIRSQSWRTGFQSLALVAFINFFIGVLYRPASLYHPQRRAILHLKSLQKKTRHNHHRESAATIAAINATNNIINNFNNNKIQKNGSHNNNGHPQVTNGPSHVNHANGGPGSHTNSVHGQSSHGKSVYFDFTILKSKTIRILLSGTCISSFGLWAPIFLLAYHGEKAGMAYSALLGLQTFLGLGIVLGTVAFGLIVVKNSVDCMIARQYLCQASSLMISASLLAFSALDDYSGYLLFVWIYGFFLGGYMYSLKMYVYEKVRARNFNRAWSFVQCVQAVPIMVGVPITGFISEYYGNKSGFFLSSFCTAFGSLTLFLIDGSKRSYDDSKHKISSLSPERTYGFTTSGMALDNYETSPVPYGIPEGRVFIDPLVFTSRPLIPGPNGTDNLAQVNFTALKALSAAAAAAAASSSSSSHHHHHHHVSHPSLLGQVGSNHPTNGESCGELYSSVNQHSCGPNNIFNSSGLTNNSGQNSSSPSTITTTTTTAAAAAAASAELTCISEEVFMENLIDDYCQADCIHPNSEEKYLMLSEINKSHNHHHLNQMNESTHNNLSSFGKHSTETNVTPGKSILNRFNLTPLLTGDMDLFENSYPSRGGMKFHPVQRRASLPIISNTASSAYLSDLNCHRHNGEGSTTTDEGLTNKLAAMEGDIEGFLGDLLNRKLSSSTMVTSENGINDCCSIANNNNGGLRWRSASESTGYIGDEGGSDDSNSDQDRLVNRCSGCLRFVQHNHGHQGIAINDGGDQIDSPLIVKNHQHQSISQENHQVRQSFNQPETINSVSQSSSQPLPSPITESTPELFTETKLSETKSTIESPTIKHNLITDEKEINDYDNINHSKRFNEESVKD
ncbi:uncharacterized protein LOC128386308 [Panonychus citri]|uniref:uncharacterized protein LOC128386308 n=1 Tax=Panonychus citri TaxID=50023 RepID=UPI002307D601|nr:uncharacterized protein LOC128386308 [Panonychus citri]